MKKIDSLKDIPVIMMSSDGEMEIVATCMEKGAADYIIKPIRYIIYLEFKISKIYKNISLETKKKSKKTKTLILIMRKFRY